MATRPNGDVRVCCTSNASGADVVDSKEVGLIRQNGVKMNLRNHTIEEVWNSDSMRRTRLQISEGKIPESCTKCFEEESKGIKSKRNWETIVWNERLNLRDIVTKMNSDGSMPVEIPYFDLRLGNLCNLKCVMCSPHDSSSWIKDYKIQYPKYKSISLIKDSQWDRTMDYTWYKKGSFIDSMKNQIKYIKELYFAGGEPLLIPEHYSILQWLVDEGHSKNVILRYNSNGTELPEHLIKLWEQFKLVKFNFSIDAYGDKNDYIRYPSKWTEIASNLHMLDETSDNIVVNVACAVNLLNVCYLDELVDWKMGQNFTKVNTKQYGAGLIGLHLVYLPSYLNVRVLPEHIKRHATLKINQLLKRYSDSDFDNDPYGKQRWIGLINYMSTDWTHKLPDCVEYLKTTDETRGTDFTKTFPLLSGLEEHSQFLQKSLLYT